MLKWKPLVYYWHSKPLDSSKWNCPSMHWVEGFHIRIRGYLVVCMSFIIISINVFFSTAYLSTTWIDFIPARSSLRKTSKGYYSYNQWQKRCKCGELWVVWKCKDLICLTWHSWSGLLGSVLTQICTDCPATSRCSGRLKRKKSKHYL